MKAIVCSVLGSVDELQTLEVPVPTPGPGEVRVDVKAASINFMDVLKVKGLYQDKSSLPFTLGGEFSGVVSEVGPGVQNVVIGERVAALGSGAFAEEAVVNATRVVRIPGQMSFQDAAALFVVYGTALRALKKCGRLAAGESLLVLGGAGGAGLAAIEVGKAMGAKVIGVASTPEKRQACLRTGASAAIGYDRLREQCEELTAGKGIDVVFDPVGGPMTEAALRTTGWGGRLIVVGFAAGSIGRIPLNLLLLKERTIAGVYLGGSLDNDPTSSSENLEMLKTWYTQGIIRPVITAAAGFKEVPAILGRLERREVVGKIVVLPEE